MELDLARYFVKVIQFGSLTKAAESLKVPKSTLSKALARLEDETGTKLLLRTTRSLTLTAAGRAYYETCLGPIQTLEEAQRSLHGQDSILSGLVRITAPEDLGGEVIASIVSQLTQQHQHLNFDLQYTDEIVDLVRDGFDLAVRIGQLRSSSLKVRKIGELTLVLVASPEYLKTSSKIKSPADLQRQNCVSMNVGSNSFVWSLRNRRETLKLKINPRITSNQMTSVLQMTLAGGGIALVPIYLCERHIRSQKLVRILPEWTMSGLPVSLVSPLASSSSARLKLVSEKLYEGLQIALSHN